MKNIDVLFVINQDCNLDFINKIYNEQGFKSALFLTTHAFLKNELEYISDRFNGDIITRIFPDFIDDLEMEECDDNASERLAEIYDNEIIKSHYSCFFMKLSLLEKNKKAHERLKKEYSFKKIFFSPGLGICKAFWERKNAENLETYLLKRPDENDEDPQTPAIEATAGGYFQKIIAKLKSFLANAFKTIAVTIVEHDNNKYVFFSSLKRLKFNKKAKIHNEIIKSYRYLNFNIFKNSEPDIIKRWLGEIASDGSKILISTTIHEYDYGFLNSVGGTDPMIFVDGFHPHNYPRSYIDAYVNGTFVVRNMFDVEWFARHGKKTLISPEFIEKSVMNIEAINNTRKIKNIILTLNHAGDWTATINRSDTDILIEAFIDAAKKITDANFIIRLHPTMAHESHEGKNSIRRIKKYVEILNLSNLSVSDLPLNEDLSRGDLFVSEYSQVLIDVFLSGKLGIISNFTGRRSLLDDFEKIGFLSVNSQDAFQKMLKDVITQPSKYVSIQKNAMLKYNDALKEFYSKRK